MFGCDLENELDSIYRCGVYLWGVCPKCDISKDNHSWKGENVFYSIWLVFGWTKKKKKEVFANTSLGLFYKF